MIDYVGMLKEFHEKFDHYIGILPHFPPSDVIDLRERLIKEECKETTDELAGDLVLLADGLADLLYVVFGTALAYGIPIEEVFTEVHRTNMNKSYDKVNGKSEKGIGWEPPKIKEILDKYKFPFSGTGSLD